MRYISLFSGIEAASIAWHPLGWEALAFAEVEPFPCAVLAHHYPNVPNLGDVTKFNEWPDYDPDVVVGGSPCQAFSVAGLRKGLDDPRGNLTLTYLAVVAKYRPRWVVWENVPGVLSDTTGAFAALLGGLGELGYGWAYRVLDAQFFGVPQRRRRVFAVGHLGDWRRAAAVLFERHSLQGHPPPSREEGQNLAKSLRSSAGRCGGMTGDEQAQIVPVAFGGNNCRGPIDVATACNASGTASGRQDFETETFVVCQDVADTITSVFHKHHGASGGKDCLPRNHVVCATGDVTHTLKADGFDASEDGTGRGTPLVPIAFGWQNSARRGASASASASVTPTLDKSKTPAIAFHENQRHELTTNETAGSLKVGGGKPGQGYPAAMVGSAVRRLTPRECERLQGFPDDWTLVPYRGKQASDGPRYKALGNSMAVPCMAWIGQRIALVESLAAEAR